MPETLLTLLLPPLTPLAAAVETGRVVVFGEEEGSEVGNRRRL